MPVITPSIRKMAVYLLVRRHLAWALLLVSGAAFSLCGSPPTQAGPLTGKPVVVLDPGHGGEDTGAKHPEGGVEKDETLSLAKRIADQIGGDYRTVLTRNDDYPVDIDARTSAANHLHADVFVSLHAPGGLRPPSEQVQIFYYRDIEDDRPLPANAPPTAEASDWESRQLGHLDSSKALAAEIEKQLYARIPGLRVQIADAPLAVLAGADMPAVLIEAAGLTLSAGGGREKASRRLDAVAQAVSAAIVAFLSSAGR
jgi:N-acetylmuramoyl-L-alanine amidase